MSLAASNERSFDAQALQILQNELPEEIIADFAEHTRGAPQTPQISRRVGSTSSDTQQIAVKQRQFASGRKAGDGIPEDVGNQDSQTNHIHHTFAMASSDSALRNGFPISSP
jgi:hypothetical protein